ncbi:MAG: hypothetical protein IJT53_06295 [Prevotella sp.]|nr:hypothetical protein [Prevotella sp.]
MNIKEYYAMAIKVADQVLKDPQNNVNEVLKSKLGYERGVKGFFSDPWNLLLLSQPLFLGSRVLYKYIKNKERQRQEMEMMKRTIIAKQQAIIKKMEEENIQNEEQRRNMQETIDFLEETLSRIEEAKRNKN